MIRVVLDTNVIVSGLLAADSLPATILDLALQGKIHAALSPSILAELDRVLRRPRFAFEPRKIGSFLALFKSRSKLVSPKKTLNLCKRDSSDNRFLECAEAAGEVGAARAVILAVAVERAGSADACRGRGTLHRELLAVAAGGAWGA